MPIMRSQWWSHHSDIVGKRSHGYPRQCILPRRQNGRWAASRFVFDYLYDSGLIEGGEPNLVDGRRLASAGDDRTLRLRDAASGAFLAVLRGHEGWARACAFAPDGRRLALAGEDRTLRLWDAVSGQETGFRVQHFVGGGWLRLI